MHAVEDDGFVRVVARKSDCRIFQIHAVWAHVSELVDAFTKRWKWAVLRDIAGTSMPSNLG